MQINNQKLQGIPGEIVLDSQEPVKSWKELRYGMFIHLGLYSYLGGVWKGEEIQKGYSEQIQMWADIAFDEYKKVASHFTLECFNAEAICLLAKSSGMNYIVVTSKHHDGFCMFKTKTTDYNVVDSTPFGKDVLQLLSEECAKQGLKFGVYFSLVDWHQGHDFDFDNNNTISESMEALIEQQLTELMCHYGPIAEVWFDMSSPSKRQSIKFKEIVRKYQPGAAINGRIWNNKGDFRTLNDNQVPSERLDGAWQTPASIYNATWGYRSWQKRDNFDVKVRNLLHGLIAARARGGNYLLNVGPQADGSLVDFEKEVLKAIGKEIKRHPEAILEANPTKFYKQEWGEITSLGQDLFLHVMNPPEDNRITLSGLVSQIDEVVEDQTNQKLVWSKENLDLKVNLPDDSKRKNLIIIKVELAEPFYLIPGNTVSIGKNDVWKIPEEAVEYGYNYADQGNYTSLVKANVRQSFYLSNDSAGEISIRIFGNGHHDYIYSVKAGSEEITISGKDLTQSEIGPFNIHVTDTIIPVHITLANPDYFNQDMELKVESIHVALNYKERLTFR
ncbi:alpha-L-fucosidase [Oceanobacillus sojae]|uniref:alpha-L-fucosidase n=1 Tax=Oceanobacillus sojae TaxID=582851 RepID=UPI0021A604EE|nr:alpha-L-fucosidase [Oceanobacillus sojae]MCT1901526.1 alpha-L-fucosidase [Oceanobacillus sojae]